MVDATTEAPKADATAEEGSAGSLWGRIVAGVGRMTSLILGGRKRFLLLTLPVCLLAMGGIALIFFLGWKYRDTDRIPSMTAALEELEAGNLDAARAIALKVRAGDASYDDERIALFILGKAMARDAQQHWNPQERPALYLVAARYLQESEIRGFPEGFESEGVQLLGDCLYRAGSYHECLPYLHERIALESKPDPSVKLALGRSYLRLANPELDEARRWIEQVVAAEEASDPARDEARLDLTRIALRQGDWEEAAAQLDAMSDEAALEGEKLVARGWTHLKRGDSLLPDEGDDLPLDSEGWAPAQEAYERAAELFRQAQGRGTGDDNRRQAQYLLGVTYRQQMEFELAEAQLSLVRRVHIGSAESIAAGLEEAEVQQLTGKSDESLTSYLRLLNELNTEEDLVNPWLSKQEFQTRLVRGFDHYLRAGRFDLGIELARAAPPHLSETTSIELIGQGYREWARELTAQSRAADFAEGESLSAEARVRWRQAGEAFYSLADLRKTTRSYADDLWESAECFMSGQNYGVAVKILPEFLQHAPRGQQAPALLRLGEAHLALGDLDSAYQSLRECRLSYPDHPMVFRARLISADVFVERGERERAKGVLNENLDGGDLTPQSLEWKESLFAMGRLLYMDAVRLEAESREVDVDSEVAALREEGIQKLEAMAEACQEALDVLEHALERYPNAPQALEARYMAAECHRQASKLPRKKIPIEEIASARSILRQQMNRQLIAAVAEYQVIREELVALQEERDLSPSEERMLRNCHFHLADSLYYLGNYEEAILAYSAATSRYQSEPAVLEAYVQLAACYRQLNRPFDARSTLEQAKIVLSRIPETEDFASTTRFSRRDWVTLLDWLSTL